MHREISAYTQNPPPRSAEQWWKPPPTLMAHPLSFASFAANIVPPTCSSIQQKLQPILNLINMEKGREKEFEMNHSSPGYEMGVELYSSQYNEETLQREGPIL